MDITGPGKRPDLLVILSLAAWAAVLAYLIFDQNFALFLKPGFQGLVYLSLVISLGFTGSLVLVPATSPKWGIDRMIKAGILILPIIFIIAAGEATLGEYALTKRPMVAPKAQDPPPAEEGSKEKRAGTDSEPEKSGTTSISSLVLDFTRFDGKSVSIEGLYARNVAGNENLSAVFRYFVTCCAADAQPVGVFITHNPDLALQDNDWVRATGRVRQDRLDGYDIIFMDIQALEPAEKPGKSAAYIYN